MKYKILEVSEDANKNITVEVNYVDGSREEKKVFNFDPEKTKDKILEAINNGSPLPELTEEEITKEKTLRERQSELESEVDKETEISIVKDIIVK